MSGPVAIGHQPLEEIREVTRDAVRKFAYAVGSTSPWHVDLAAARAKGFRDLLAPRSFVLSLGLSFGRVTSRDRLGVEGLALDDPLSGRRVVAGALRIEWSDDVFAGDVLVVSQVLRDVTVKQGRSGTLEFYEFERRYVCEGRELAVETFVRIAR